MTAWSSFTRCGFLKKIAGVSLVVCQFGCIAHIVLEYVGGPIVCSGPSMQPTINPGNIVLASAMKKHKNIQLGDIVIAVSPMDPFQNVCKRIVALEGDRVKDPLPTMISSFVPRGHVWLEGDNKENTKDSTTYGPVPMGLIKSKVVYRVWPPSEMGKLPPFDDAR